MGIYRGGIQGPFNHWNGGVKYFNTNLCDYRGDRHLFVISWPRILREQTLSN